MSSRRTVTVTRSEEETAELAARLAASLPPGSVVLLTGDLGAGKTAFVRGMAIGLGIDPDEVSSPTFTLIQEYRVRARTPPVAHRPGAGESSRTLYHVDLYRLEAAEIDDLGLEELTAGGGVAAIEWAEKLGRPPEGAVRVSIAEEGSDARRITIVETDAGTVNGEPKTEN